MWISSYNRKTAQGGVSAIKKLSLKNIIQHVRKCTRKVIPSFAIDKIGVCVV